MSLLFYEKLGSCEVIISKTNFKKQFLKIDFENYYFQKKKKLIFLNMF